MCMETVVLETAIPPGSRIGRLIALPKAGTLSEPFGCTGPRSVALLRLHDGTVWMLAAYNNEWTVDRLRLTADVLATISKDPYNKGSLQRLLSERTNLELTAHDYLSVTSLDQGLWNVAMVSVGIAELNTQRHAESMLPPPRTDISSWAIEDRLLRRLKTEYSRFIAALDPEMLGIASASGRLNLRIYNYLVHRDHRHFRLQFAATFPCLLTSCIVGESRTRGNELRAAVDSGAPLIRTLAKCWGVRTGVLRHLVHRTHSEVGVQWSRDAHGLALSLNALNPADLPGDKTGSWAAFNRLVADGQRLFGRPVWESEAGLEWLRDRVREDNRGTREARRKSQPDWNSVSHLARLRQVLFASLQREAFERGFARSGTTDRAIRYAIDSLIPKLAESGVAEVATDFADELDSLRRKGAAWKLANGEMMMSLIPGDFISSDGTRRIRSLISKSQLAMLGSQLRNCLASGFVPRTPQARHVRAEFVVAVYDAKSGKAVSAAEIHVRKNKEPSKMTFSVIQHTSKANRPPSSLCVNAVHELIRYCGSRRVLEHLASGWRMLESLEDKDSCALEEDRLRTVSLALRSVLGTPVYDGLLRTVADRIMQAERQGGQ